MNIHQEFLFCQRDFSYFTKNYVKFSHPTKGSIPCDLHQYQKDFLDFYEKNQFILLNKFRQSGFTTLSFCYAMWNCMFKSGHSYYFAGKTANDAIHIGNLLDKFIDAFPTWLVPDFVEKTPSYIKFSATGSEIYFGDVYGVIGKKITHLIVDEAAFIPNMKEKWRRISYNEQSPRLDSFAFANVKVCFLSSVNPNVSAIDNWFYEMWRNAQNKLNKFVTFKANYKDHPAYSNEEVVNKLRKQMGEKSFQHEILSNFEYEDSPDLSFISDEDLYGRVEDILNESAIPVQDQIYIREMMKRTFSPLSW